VSHCFIKSTEDFATLWTRPRLVGWRRAAREELGAALLGEQLPHAARHHITRLVAKVISHGRFDQI